MSELTVLTQKQDENISWWPADEVTRVQIKLLHSVGLLYSGDLHLSRFGARYSQDFATFCQERWQFGTEEVHLNESEPLETQFRTWVTSEVRNRTGYCIWVSPSYRRTILVD